AAERLLVAAARKGAAPTLRERLACGWKCGSVASRDPRRRRGRATDRPPPPGDRRKLRCCGTCAGADRPIACRRCLEASGVVRPPPMTSARPATLFRRRPGR